MLGMCNWNIKGIKGVWVQVHSAALGRAWLCLWQEPFPGILAGAPEPLCTAAPNELHLPRFDSPPRAVLERAATSSPAETTWNVPQGYH